jgi:tetratricopeptide (TPR) repeat protein
VHLRAAAVLAEEGGNRPLRVADAVGTHLEAALDERTPEDPTIASHAAGHLAAAGALAEQAGDDAAAASLFGRAAALLPVEDPQRIHLLLARGRAFARLGEHRRAQDAFVDASRTARAADDRDGELRTKVLLASLRVRTGVDIDVLEEVRETADRAIETFGELGDELGLAWGWGLRALVHRSRGHATAQADAARRAADHAVGAGDAGEEASALCTVAEAIAAGPGLLSEAIEDCRAVAARARGHRAAVLDVTATLAVLHARRGEPDEARRLAHEAVAAARDLGLERQAISAAFRAGLVEAVAGDAAAAETVLRDALAAAGDPDAEAPRAAIAASLARVLLDLGRPSEALELAELAGRAAPRDDWSSQVWCRSAWARASAELGHLAEGLATAREAVRMAEQTDSTGLRAEALLDLAHVLELAGRPNEAVPIARRALRGLSRTGATAPAARARALLERLSAPRGAGSGPAEDAAEPAAAAEPEVDGDGGPHAGTA